MPDDRGNAGVSPRQR